MDETVSLTGLIHSFAGHSQGFTTIPSTLPFAFPHTSLTLIRATWAKLWRKRSPDVTINVPGRVSWTACIRWRQRWSTSRAWRWWREEPLLRAPRVARCRRIRCRAAGGTPGRIPGDGCRPRRPCRSTPSGSWPTQHNTLVRRMVPACRRSYGKHSGPSLPC